MKPPSPREEDIFLTALECASAADRTAYLDLACGADEELRQTVEDLLADHERAGTLFRDLSSSITLSCNAVPPRSVDPDVEIGRSIGAYTITRLLGEGGNGVVYEAAQQVPVRRKVALKILKPGMDSRQIIARFEAERQTLALMEHPNIARVIDAGATPLGRPYFVMELVDGARITDFCESLELDLASKLRLMRDVCAGVQHAHQKGIIHRDLKPSNILIDSTDGHPRPKIIDFGIAKATMSAPDGGVTHTSHGQLIGTPAYMSPEQIQGMSHDIDTRSDVYSLGIILYELITGSPPFENDALLGAGIDEMRRRVMHEEPSPPSLKIHAHAGRHERDLDWIVLKALNKDRERRYATVRALDQDIGRFLEGEPVEAHPPSRWYRLGKLVNRNRLASATTAIAALTLLGGLAVSTTLYLRARAAERQQARLRLEAEERARVTKAAILLMQGKTVEADAEIRGIENTLSQPSVEATNVFRTLSTWNASHDDWTTAADRLLALSRVNRFDDSDMTDNATRDLVPVAPTLIQAGRLDAYQEFENMIIRRLGHTNNPVAAEHVLKICLQLPVDAITLDALRPVAEVAARSIDSLKGGTPTDRMGSWRCAVLGLWHYRKMQYAEAVHWCDRALAVQGPEQSRLAYIRIVRAMSEWSLTKSEAARLTFQELNSEFTPKAVEPFAHQSDEEYWHDWLCVRILLREARDMMRLSSPNQESH